MQKQKNINKDIFKGGYTKYIANCRSHPLTLVHMQIKSQGLKCANDPWEHNTLCKTPSIKQTVNQLKELSHGNKHKKQKKKTKWGNCKCDPSLKYSILSVFNLQYTIVNGFFNSVFTQCEVQQSSAPF